MATSPSYSVPNDIIVAILNNLLIYDPHYSTAKAIFSMSCASRTFNDIVNVWCNSKVTLAAIAKEHPNFERWCNYKNTLSWLKGPNACPPEWPDVVAQTGQVTVSDLCKRLGWICALCNNRAKKDPWVEPFTDLQLCMACDNHKYPKISVPYLGKIFASLSFRVRESISFGIWLNNRNIQDLLAASPSRSFTTPHHHEDWDGEADSSMMLRKDVMDFFSASGDEYIGVDRADPIVGEEHSRNGELYLAELMEAMGIFEHVTEEEICYSEILHTVFRESPKFRDWNEAYIPHSIRVLLCYGNLETGNFDWGCMPTPPPGFGDDWDRLLFEEFRYQFDPYLQKVDSNLESEIYTECIKIWTRKNLRQERPWSPEFFPLPPPASRIPEQMDFPSKYDFETYNLRCASLRAAFKRFPDALMDPSLWRKGECSLLNRRQGDMTGDDALTAGIARFNFFEE
jgi:hypothetical protein